MFRVKIMSEQDFPFAVQLTDEMDWDMVEEDFTFMKRLEPEGCFVLFADQERTGVATTVSFGEKGWFGNLIVKEKHRGRGAGSLLVEHSLNYLRSRDVKTIGLYAYIDKVNFYERLGFKYDSRFIVLKGKGFSSAVDASVSEAGRKDTQQIIDYDSVCFGASRRKILEAILNDPNNVGYKSTRNGRMVGYALAKVYDGVADVGPLICPEGCSDLAINLLEAVLNRLKDTEVSLCVPEKERKILSILLKNRFAEKFRVVRMFFGEDSFTNCIYVAESLERG
jgi:GNAT superfamily N-acetyltransferase